MKKVILISAVVLLTACGTGFTPKEIKADSVKSDSVKSDSVHIDTLTIKK
jgi:starvation-inducible outer membrane lipoprotein